MTKHLLFCSLFAWLLLGCQDAKTEKKRSEKGLEMERGGQDCLRKARTALERKDYATARQHVETLRKDFYLALNAREEGILLMDSIALFEAQDELQALDEKLQKTDTSQTSKRKLLQAAFDEQCQKIKFYHRKIQHDKTNKKKH